ncbi:MAG: 6-pyruvoyl-tetrahydropterin synthase-related protein [Candidatus Pacebacteria bacterium]|nr:6-pyruvoyl-tetrahydropterin synthase-related protein [Candidatus Paceibacterota bacterium]
MIFFLIILALISFKPYLSNSFPYTHDGENHLARFANYKVAIREGQFPPRFAPNLLNHYGYPVFNYNYPLANIISLPFSFLKVNYELTFKIIVFSFVLAGLFGVNKWLESLSFDKRSRMFASSIFALTPYLINALSYRGNIGEVMSFCLLPWLFYTIENPVKNHLGKNSIKFLGQTLIWIMFFLSHNIAVLFGTPILIIYSLIKYKKEILKQFSLILSFILGIISTLWFWLPAVFEKNLVVLDNAELSKNYVDHFPTLSQLLFSPLEFGFSKVGSIDSLSFNIGLAQISILVFAFILLKKKIENKQNQFNKIKLFLIASLILLLLQLHITIPLWRILPLVNFIQFPWRLTMFIGILVLPIAAFVFERGNKITKFILLSVVFIQLITVLKVKPADYFHKNNIDYEAFTQTTSTANENLAKTFTYSEFADWKPSAKILSGEGQISTTEWRGSKRKYTVNVNTESVIVEPTMHFKGWETQVNGNDITYIDNEEIKGRIAYKLPVGEHIVSTKFTQNSWPRMTGNILSGLGILSIVSIVLFSQISKIKNVIKK